MVDKKSNQVIYCTVEEKEYLKKELEKYRLKKKADKLGLSISESNSVSASTTSVSTSDTLLRGINVTKISNELHDEIRLGLIMFGYERDKRANDTSKGNEMHWANWIQTKSPYPQDEKKIDAILDKLYMRAPVNPFLKKKR